MLYTLLSILIIGVLFLILIISSKYKWEKKNKEEYIQKKKEKFDKEFKEEDRLLREVKQQRTEFEKNYYQQKNNYTAILEERKKEVDSLIAQQNALVEQKQSDIDKLIEQHYQHKQEDYERTLREVQTALQEDAEAEMNSVSAKLYTELFELKGQIDEYKAKRDAINEEILRQRAIEEKQDFYRVCLSQNDIDDIHILNSIRTNLHKHDGLDKLIYDFYISKPVQEMVKRVLGGSAPSGIYKITRLKTGEIYIGKSTDIKSRWQQHTKTVFGCGTIAHSILHTTMEKDGIENFTFELLEEVPKDKLTEREKYWIGFYDTKKYGLNEREG